MTLTTEHCRECGSDYKLQRQSLTGRLHVACDCDERATAVQVAGRLPGEPHHE